LSKSTPKQLLWRAFADYIKLRDTPGGFGNCISCNKIMAYPNPDGLVHAGHLWPRSVVYNALYFHEMNVHAQCAFCNTHLEGNTLEFRKGIIRRYGDQVMEKLDLLKRGELTQKLYDHDYKEMAKDYRKRVREIKQKRGLK